MPVPKRIQRKLRDEWVVDTCSTCSSILVCLFPCFFAFLNRRNIISKINEPYICCGGIFRLCSKPVQNHGFCCLCLESFFCFSYAVLGNHFLIQTRFDRKNTRIDTCMTFNADLCRFFFCWVGVCFGENVLDFLGSVLADTFFYCLYPCLESRHLLELRQIKEYHGINKRILQGMNEYMIRHLTPPAQMEMNTV
jgi:hypothetical protein